MYRKEAGGKKLRSGRHSRGLDCALPSLAAPPCLFGAPKPNARPNLLVAGANHPLLPRAGPQQRRALNVPPCIAAWQAASKSLLQTSDVHASERCAHIIHKSCWPPPPAPHIAQTAAQLPTRHRGVLHFAVVGPRGRVVDPRQDATGLQGGGHREGLRCECRLWSNRNARCTLAALLSPAAPPDVVTANHQEQPQAAPARVTPSKTRCYART